jgi:hypothetical protein
MHGRNLDLVIADLARRQHGAISRSQLRSAGASPGQIKTRLAHGVLEPRGRWVLRVASAPSTWLHRSWVTVLQAQASGGTSALADIAAARVHGFDGRPTDRVIVGASLRNFVEGTDGTIRYLPSLSPADVMLCDALPVTSPVRTLLDLAMTHDERRLATILDGAVRDGLLTEDDLRARLATWRQRGRHGVARLVAVLGDDPSQPSHVIAGRPHTYLEREFVGILQEFALPKAVCQEEVIDADGRLRRLDVRLAGTMIVCELEGQLGHADRVSRSKDLERMTALRRAGYIVLRFTYDDVMQRRSWVAMQVRREVELEQQRPTRVGPELSVLEVT